MRHFWTWHEDISSEDSNLHEKDLEKLNISMSNTYQYPTPRYSFGSFLVWESLHWCITEAFRCNIYLPFLPRCAWCLLIISLLLYYFDSSFFLKFPCSTSKWIWIWGYDLTKTLQSIEILKFLNILVVNAIYIWQFHPSMNNIALLYFLFLDFFFVSFLIIVIRYVFENQD